MAIGKVMVRTHEEVSLNTSESDTGVSRLAKANERRIGEANRLPWEIKKPPFEVVFLLAIGKVMVRTFEESEFDKEDKVGGSYTKNCHFLDCCVSVCQWVFKFFFNKPKLSCLERG